MSLRYYLFFVFVTTLLALGWFVVTLFNIDPNKATLSQLSGFFISLFLIIWGAATFIGFFIRIRLSNNEIVFANFPISFRQGLEISVLSVCLLFLKSIAALNLWTAILVAIILILVEMFFRTWKK